MAEGWLGPLLGGAATLYGGYLSGRRDDEQAALDRDLRERTSGSRGWDVVDPILQRAAGEAERIYDNRIGQGGYGRNVPKPRRVRGASGSQRELAGRAREIAMAGPSSTVTGGQDYISGLLGGTSEPGTGGDFLRQSGNMFGGIPTGTAAGMYQGLGDGAGGSMLQGLGSGRAASMFAGLPYGQGASMYDQAFDLARDGGNQYIPELFGLAQGMAGGDFTSSGPGAGGVNARGFDINLDDPRFSVDPSTFNMDLSDPRFSVDPNAFDINTRDPRLRINPRSGAIGPAADLDSQGYVRETMEGGATGTAGHIANLLNDPFAMSNPQLENMVRLQQEDLQSAHESELGRLNEAAGNVGAYGGSNFQLARSEAASDLGRNIERASTGLRYDDYDRRIADRMTAMNLGAGMDTAALAQAANLEIAHRQDLTDREKADLSAMVARQLANQGTLANLLEANQGTGAGLAAGNRDLGGLLARSNQSTGAGLAAGNRDLGGRLAQGNQSTGASLAGLNAELASRARLAQYGEAGADRRSALSAMLGAAGLQNDSQLGRLGLMGSYAQSMGGLEQAGAAGLGGLEMAGAQGMSALDQYAAQGMGDLELSSAAGLGDVGSSLGGIELGALGQIPGLEGIEMGQIGQAFGLESEVARRNAAASAANAQAMNSWNRNRMQWDYNREAGALNDLINQSLRIGGHVTTPTGLGGVGAQATGNGGAAAGAGLAGLASLFSGGGGNLGGILGGGSGAGGFFGQGSATLAPSSGGLQPWSWSAVEPAPAAAPGGGLGYYGSPGEGISGTQLPGSGGPNFLAPDAGREGDVVPIGFGGFYGPRDPRQAAQWGGNPVQDALVEWQGGWG